MLRAALDVPHPLPPQLPLEGRGATPCDVLAAIVGQHLLRHAVRRDRSLEPLEHQLGLLMVRQGVPHQESRVVVDVAHQVQPLVPAQQECEDIRLPHLVGLRPLETPRGPWPSRPH